MDYLGLDTQCWNTRAEILRFAARLRGRGPEHMWEPGDVLLIESIAADIRSQVRQRRKTMETFPVLWSRYNYKINQAFEAAGCPALVPWDMVEPHRKQAEKNHSQSLETLAERGGLGVNELVAVLEGLGWGDIVQTEQEAIPRLLELVEQFKTRQHEALKK